MPIQGDGHTSRAFLWAGDASKALDVIFHKGTDGETYNISSNDHSRVREVTEKIFQLFHLDRTHEFDDWIKFLRALGWKQRMNFDEALWVTVGWYCQDSEGVWLNCDGSASTVVVDGDIVIAGGDHIRAV
ncbi:hypothetical protein ABOM_002924 [Aspergillus bombycis]|uniref:Uncharacterized protein n=1 Tax=Aspergillus bombycis TaxID=109264 RepID=A0A1F8A8Q0_9EURO|nr:hypothetical protein ABOM_002924 [Aspergillus bombycis]OGM48150.1 hypothetical protein ABOM_002924 [Aspergillus bombycis]